MTSLRSSVIPGARDRAGNDPIFIWNEEARRRAAGGESILNATIGALMGDDGRLCTLPTVTETLTRLVGTATAGYAPISGLPTYRDAVIRDLFGEGPLAERAVAVATPGGTGAVYQAVVNFLEPGQRILVPSFFWGPYREITTHSGRGLDTFAMFGADGSFNLDGLEASLADHVASQGRALVVLNFPCHNPTGYTLSPEEWQRVARVIEQVGSDGPVTVLIDAAYMEFGGPAARTWIDAVSTLIESATVLVAWTASKSMAQYGARIGAIVGLHRDAEECAQIGNALGYTCRAIWSNCNHLGQLAVTEPLTDPDLAARVERERDEIAALLQSRIRVFNEHAEASKLSTPRYDAGFFVAVFTDDEQATAAALRERGVYVVPIGGAVRVALCSTPAAMIPRLVEALEQCVGVTV